MGVSLALYRAYKKVKNIMKERYFTEANAQPNPIKEVSPSGKYVLMITGYNTVKGGWNYTRGEVRTKAGNLIADIKRNYSHFPFLWIEGHLNGHDYLVCGEDYQGQTVIELDTGKRRDHLPEEAKEGTAFCWADMRFDISSQILVVNGCFWACPYEFRFYDFSDPMQGWTWLETPSYIPTDEKQPKISSNSSITCYQTSKIYLPTNQTEDDLDLETITDADYENPDNWKIEKDVVTLYSREGDKLILIGEMVSAAETARRQESARLQAEYEEWKTDFKANDPLYLKYAELVQDKTLSPEEYMRTGVTYKGWCPDFFKEEARWCRRIVKGHKRYTVDLEWAVMTGPIKLVIYQHGNHSEDLFFPHTVSGMERAFLCTKELL